MIKVSMVCVNDMVGEKGQAPGRIIPAPFEWFILNCLDFLLDCVKIETFNLAGFGKGHLATATEVYPVFLKNRCSPVILGNYLAYLFLWVF